MANTLITTTQESSTSPRFGIWSHTVVKMGLEYPFLLRAVLSVSALRLAQDESSHEWFLESAVHMEAGLTAFRQLIATGDPNSDEKLQSALFAFSSLLVVQNFGLAVVEQPKDSIEEFVKCIRLVRGVGAVLRNAWEVVQKAELAPIIFGATFVEKPEHGPENQFLASLKTMMSTSELPEEDATALIQALEHLQAIAAEHFLLRSGVGTSQATSVGVLLSWPGRVPERALELMDERNPCALCMIAYMASLLVSAGSHWWIEGWDKLLHDAVVPFLPSALAADLVHAMAQNRLDTANNDAVRMTTGVVVQPGADRSLGG
ncbi:uncharacterized protein AB675_555 [Cyphellophora attinorum]|uniref:Uncharacterized protein n=1 Tax=Cyphellophora attinorum TaxID=1664694 RepID=A0A0N0NS51_9EURO|nr:uncharacterized protein AB675_555 [Phialophora attinorum]KPI45851.1 hypothetical protein AB675_555 [Phialophora attinorum]